MPAFNFFCSYFYTIISIRSQALSLPSRRPKVIGQISINLDSPCSVFHCKSALTVHNDVKSTTLKQQHAFGVIPNKSVWSPNYVIVNKTHVSSDTGKNARPCVRHELLPSKMDVLKKRVIQVVWALNCSKKKQERKRK